MLVPIRHYEKRRNAETSVMGTKRQLLSEEEEFKIKVFSPTHKSISIENEKYHESKKTTANFNINFVV